MCCTAAIVTLVADLNVAVGTLVAVADVGHEVGRRVLVIGAGGHARVAIEALRDDPTLHVVGCLSRDGGSSASSGVDVVGADDQITAVVAEHRVTHAFVAIGNNRTRAGFHLQCAQLGLPLVNAISGGARLSPSAQLGSGVMLAPGAVVNAAARLGDGVIVNTNASVDYDCIIGDHSHIAPGVAMGGTVMIGAGVLVGIGARIVPGVTIGEGATIGAGTVVVRDVPAGTVVVGTPARRVDRKHR